MHFRKAVSVVGKVDAGTTFELAPAALPELFAQGVYLANVIFDGDNLDMADWAVNLKSHAVTLPGGEQRLVAL